MTDYGSDIAGIDDIDSELSFVEGPRVVIESVARRFGCVPGSLEDDPTYGDDLTLLIGDTVDLETEQRKMVQQARYDDRVATASASMTQAAGKLDASLAIELAGGESFELIMGVGSLKIDDIVIREAE